jgi:hypothetical protein
MIRIFQKYHKIQDFMRSINFTIKNKKINKNKYNIKKLLKKVLIYNKNKFNNYIINLKVMKIRKIFHNYQIIQCLSDKE